MATDLTPGYNKATNTFVIESDIKPNSHDIVRKMFHDKEYKLRDLSKKLGMRPSKVFKVMFDKNTAEADALNERIVETEQGVWTFNMTPPTEVTPTLPDNDKPVEVSAVGISNTVLLTFNDINYLNAGAIPSADKFVVMINDKKIGVSRVQITRNTNVVKLIISTNIKFGDNITVEYMQPEKVSNQLQDTAKNTVNNFTAEVSNTTPNPNPVENPNPENTENTTPPGDETPPAS